MSSTTRILRPVRVIALAQDGRILLDGGPSAWRLPRFQSETKGSSDASTLSREARRALGLRVTLLRFARDTGDFERDWEGGTLVVEPEDVEAGPAPGLSWVPAQRLRETPLAGDEDQALVEQAIAEGVAPPALRAAWARPGWRQQAMAWCVAALESKGRRVTAEPEPVRQWNISSIHRIPTDLGAAWFKAVPPFFAYEGRLISFLERLLPGRVPTVIDAAPDRGWVLLEEISGETLRERRGSGFYGKALQVLATLQVACAPRVEDMLAIGCPDRRLATLPSDFEQLASRADVRARLTTEEAGQLRSLGDAVARWAAALSAFPVPETLLHGDFHPGNVALIEGKPLIFDWTDGCVGHPFFDLATFVHSAEAPDHERLIAAYLRAWSKVAAEDEMRLALELAMPLAFIHHAISYRRILDGIEEAERGGFAGSVEGWLRRFLATAGARDARS